VTAADWAGASQPCRVLVVDDDQGVRETVSLLLQTQGYEITEADCLQRAVAALGAAGFDLVVSDLRLGDGTGLDLLQQLRADPDPPPAILMTSFSSVETAIGALRLGAIDYILKPFSNEEMLHSVARAIRERRTLRENLRLKRSLRREQTRSSLLGRSEGLLHVLDRIKRVAPTDATVLITGESGTGKELVAQAIHDASTRAAGPFVPVNCGAIPADLIESELFGHAKGAYTGAVMATEGLIREAHGGTLFLDEVGELPLAMQVKFLRVLQDRQVRPLGGRDFMRVDVRFLAATNKDLKAAIARGEFREDLYYRLNVIGLHIPPLRERGNEVELLARHFCSHYAARMRKRVAGFDEGFLSFLRQYDWPGNVRELENLIERAVILCEGETLCYADLADSLPPIPPTPGLRVSGAAPASGAPDAEDAADAELESAHEVHPAEDGTLSVEAYIRQMILRHQDSHSEIELAHMLGIGRKALWMRRRRWGLLRPGSAGTPPPAD
jgi:DNA-binding NtrC family response regulator